MRSPSRWTSPAPSRNRRPGVHRGGLLVDLPGAGRGRRLLVPGRGWDRYEAADAYVGLTEDEARARAEEEESTVRVLARDGLRFGQDDDLRTNRVNLVVYDDEVRAAAVF